MTVTSFYYNKGVQGYNTLPFSSVCYNFFSSAFLLYADEKSLHKLQTSNFVSAEAIVEVGVEATQTFCPVVSGNSEVGGSEHMLG